jgi:hypothetical protein
MTSTPLSRAVAAALVASLLAVVPARATVADSSLAGRVLGADGVAPRAGAIVHLVLGEGEAVYSSGSTAADGSFAIDGVPAGDYALLVEAAEGAYRWPERLALAPGVNPPLALTLHAAGEQSGLGGASDAVKPWIKWLVVGVIGAIGLYVLYEVTDSEDPSTAF